MSLRATAGEGRLGYAGFGLIRLLLLGIEERLHILVVRRRLIRGPWRRGNGRVGRAGQSALALLRMQGLQASIQVGAEVVLHFLQAFERHGDGHPSRAIPLSAADHNQIGGSRIVRWRGYQLDHVSGRQTALLPICRG